MINLAEPDREKIIYWDVMNEGVDIDNYLESFEKGEVVKNTQKKLMKLTDKEMDEIVDSFKSNKELRQYIASLSLVGEEGRVYSTDGCIYTINNPETMDLTLKTMLVPGKLASFICLANKSEVGDFKTNHHINDIRGGMEVNSLRFPYIEEIPDMTKLVIGGRNKIQDISFDRVEKIENRVIIFPSLMNLHINKCKEIGNGVHLRFKDSYSKDVNIYAVKCEKIGNNSAIYGSLHIPNCRVIGDNDFLFTNGILNNLEEIGIGTELNIKSIFADKLKRVGKGSLDGTKVIRNIK